MVEILQWEVSGLNVGSRLIFSVGSQFFFFVLSVVGSIFRPLSLVG